MKTNNLFYIKLFIVATILFFTPACYSNDVCHLSKKDVIRFDNNDTPSYIKGDNLCFELNNDSHFRMLKEKGLYEDIAFQFMESFCEHLKLDEPRKDLVVKDVKIDKLNFKHIKFQQVVKGIPIWNKEISIHLNSDNNVYLFQGHYLPTPVDVATIPKISPQDAAKIAVLEISDGNGSWSAGENELIIMAMSPAKIHLTYKITLLKGFIDRKYYFIDALNGNILRKISGIQNQVSYHE